MWPYLCGGTASLKSRQLESAVCDALGFGGRLIWGVTLLGAYRGVWLPDFVGLDV